MIKLRGRSQGPPGIIMMMPFVLEDQVSTSTTEKNEGEDSLGSDEEVELDDERLERALPEEDEELGRRRA